MRFRMRRIGTGATATEDLIPECEENVQPERASGRQLGKKSSMPSLTDFQVSRRSGFFSGGRLSSSLLQSSEGGSSRRTSSTMLTSFFRDHSIVFDSPKKINNDNAVKLEGGESFPRHHNKSKLSRKSSLGNRLVNGLRWKHPCSHLTDDDEDDIGGKTRQQFAPPSKPTRTTSDSNLVVMSENDGSDWCDDDSSSRRSTTRAEAFIKAKAMDPHKVRLPPSTSSMPKIPQRTICS